MTVWQENAQAFASRAEQYLQAERNRSRNRAMELLRAGKPGQAYHEICASVTRQARISGIGHIPIGSCPCGGRCDKGRCGR